MDERDAALAILVRAVDGHSNEPLVRELERCIHGVDSLLSQHGAVTMLARHAVQNVYLSSSTFTSQEF